MDFRKVGVRVIAGFEWVVLAIFVAGALVCVYLVVSVQGDLMINDTKKGTNSDEEAVKVFLQLLAQTRDNIVIHDDGHDSKGSIYNSDRVMVAISDQIRKHGIRVRCLFNDEEQNLKLLRLARKFPRNVYISYLNGDRPIPDTHYKIVDNGRRVHLSQHEHGEIESTYVLREAPWWAMGTRRRISQAYMDHFEHGLKAATPARV